MNDFNAAVGSDSQMRATASAIASAAGLHDLKQAVTQPSMLDRPWRMLAAVATRSAQDGNFALAAQVTAAALRDLILVWAPGRAIHIR